MNERKSAIALTNDIRETECDVYKRDQLIKNDSMAKNRKEEKYDNCIDVKLDSGTTSHMINRKDAFNELEHKDCGHVNMADELPYDAIGMGDIVLTPTRDSDHKMLTLKKNIIRTGIRRHFIVDKSIGQSRNEISYGKKNMQSIQGTISIRRVREMVFTECVSTSKEEMKIWKFTNAGV